MTPSKTTAEFERMYKVLNKAQKKAVDSIEGPVMVIAGPGTGKTTILTLRIANILRKTDTAPENILALTFTESGAHNMRRKLFEVIGKPAYRVNIHTFHGFAERIIREFPDYFPRIIGSSVITEVEQIGIMEKIINSRPIKVLRPYGDPHYYVRAVLGEIHTMKRENVSPKKLLDSIDMCEDSYSKSELEKIRKRNEKNYELAYAYDKYENALKTGKFYDFEDMLLELIRAMENDDAFKLILKERYQYILADEHQDANASQNRILELLSDYFESPNLFIVGDDKQAIYRFQGASLENFLYFTNKYKDATVIELEHNYRSHQGILDASHSLIANNLSVSGQPRQKLVSLQVGSKPIYIDEFGTHKEELQYLAILIQRLIKKGEKPEEIAVLFRENKESGKIADILRAYNIATNVESDEDILNETDILKLMILCRAINDPSNSELLARALLIPEFKCDPADVSEIGMKSRFEKESLHKLIRKGAKDNLEMKMAYAKISGWTRDAEVMVFTDLLEKIIRESGIMASIVSSPDSLYRFSLLESFFDIIESVSQSRKNFYLRDFIEYMDMAKDHGMISRNNRGGKVTGVRLMTAHRAKGLEFNHVFIVNAVDGVWGNRFRRNLFRVPAIEHAVDAGRLEDERRLFYVAMTRARESVNISYSLANGDKETMQCQFISEIDPSQVSFGRPVIGNLDQPLRRKLEMAKNADLSILNPEFVRSRFLDQPFSVSHLNNYMECPWKYFFTNLMCIPETRKKSEMYGTAIHVTLKAFFDAFKEGRDFDKKRLVGLFSHYLDRQPMSLEDRRESFNKGKSALLGYYRAYISLWNRNLMTEYDVRGVELDFAGPRGKRLVVGLVGRFDKVEFIDARNAIVVDYKTAKPMSRNEIEGKTRSADGNFKRQLVFYALLLYMSKKFRMKYGEIDFIEPNERGKYKKERFEITADEIGELRKLIQETASDIIGLTFIGKACDDKDCEYCKLGKIIRK